MRFSLTGYWNNLTFLKVHNYVSPAVFSCIILLLVNLKFQYIHVHVHVYHTIASLFCVMYRWINSYVYYGPNSSVVMFGVLYKCTQVTHVCGI